MTSQDFPLLQNLKHWSGLVFQKHRGLINRRMEVELLKTSGKMLAEEYEEKRGWKTVKYGAG